MSTHHETDLRVCVVARTEAAADVVVLELAPAGETALPRWSAGAHVDVVVGASSPADPVDDTGGEAGEDVRQYSLMGAVTAPTWSIGVLREEDGSGGSRWLHDEVAVGDVLRVAGPRNHFEFEPVRGTRCLFVAGGIGITPISAMVAAAERAGVEWELHYAGRSRRSMALVDELTTTHPGRVHVYAADEGRRLDLTALYAGLPPFTVTYCCGPARLIEAIEVAATGRQLKVERFVAREVGAPQRSEPFEVELAYSGTTLVVPPDRSVLEVIEESGTLVLSSCQSGTCGTCETRVLEGEVDHRDSILTPDEQAANDVMYVCVSRAVSPRLVLEL